MARAPALLPDAEELRRWIGADGRLAIRVTPGARAEAVTLSCEAVLVKVRAPADKGAANDAVIALVARALGLAPSRVTLLRGATSRAKVLQVAL